MPRGSAPTPRRKTAYQVIDEAGKELGKRIGQVVAGPIEGTIANSSLEEGSYRPAIVDLPLSLAGLVQVIAGKKIDENSATGKALRRSERASIRTNRYLGIPQPRDTLDTLLRIGGSLVIPAKGSVVTKAARSLAPKSTAAVAKVVKATPKPVRAVARGVADVALPLRQTKTLKGTAAVAGVASGIQDVVAENFDPNYQSDVLTVDAFPASKSPEDEFAFIEAGDDEAQSGADAEFAALEAEPDIAEIDEIEANDNLSRWEQGALALGALAIGAGAIKYGRGIINANIAAAEEAIPKFTGKKFRRSRGGIGERVQTALTQQDQPLRNAADEFLSPQHAAEYKHNADLINNVSIGSRVAHTFRTGKTPKTQIRTVKLAPHAEAYAKELSLDEQRMVSDALLAQSSLDDFNRNGVLSSLNLDRDGNPVTPATLRRVVADARANPKFVKYMDAITRSYQDLLKFRVQRGTLSVEQAQELATQRPNYVRMSRDLETEAAAPESKPFNANDARGAGFSRADEELQGVQGVTGVGNPFNALMDDWASQIRLAEHNDLRKFWLENMAQANPNLVRRIPNGVKPNTPEGIHDVYENGKLISYKVNDAIASQALELSPRQSIKSLEMMRQVAQNTVTGPLGTLMNGFAFFKSPVYDTTIGMLLKPGNVKLGLINEALSKVNPKLNIGSADPTALISAYTGAARYAWDDLRGSMAQNLSEQLLKEHSWLRSLIGDNNVTALRDSLEASYENSIKSLMDEQGITSLTMHGSPDPSEVMSGLESITPRYNSAMAAQLARDTLEARRAGDVGPLKPLLAQSKSAFARARASTIARTYGHLLEAMHNGFRYSTVAANVSRNPDLAQLASQARRISIDSAQHGGSEVFNKTASAFMYANLTVQSLAAAGKLAVQNPVQFVSNLTSVALPLMAMHYLAMSSDPDALAQHAGKSVAQKAAAITTFGGAEIPVDPIMRLMIGPMMTIMDHATGAHDGKWNGPFLDAMATWLEGSADDPKALQQDTSDLLRLDWNPMNWGAIPKANLPFAPEALPAGQAVLAAAGVDPGMSRVTGEAAPIRMQGLSGFDMEQKRTDALFSGWAETMITALGGSFAQHLIGMADDAHRAYISPNGGPREAVDVGLSRYRDTMAKGAGVARPIIFGAYEQVQAVTDTNWQIVKAKEKGIEQAVNVYNKDIRAAGIATSVDPTKGDFLPKDAPARDVIGTQNAEIGAAASHLQSALAPITERLRTLAAQTEGVRNGYVTKQEIKNRKINELTEQRKYYTMLRRQIIEQYEHTIGERIGNPDFSFDDYNPDDYTAPIPSTGVSVQ